MIRIKNVNINYNLALCVVFLLVPLIIISANDTPNLDAKVQSGTDFSLIGKYSVWTNKESVMSAENQKMERLLSVLDDLNGLMKTTDSAIKAAALEYIAALGTFDVGSAAANMANIVTGITDKESLNSAIDSAENEIDRQVSKVKNADSTRNTALVVNPL